MSQRATKNELWAGFLMAAEAATHLTVLYVSTVTETEMAK